MPESRSHERAGHGSPGAELVAAACVRVVLTGVGRQGYLDGIATGLTLEQLSAPIEADPGAGVLDRLRAAAATANELRGLGDELLDRYVQAARADGASWSEIGTALGVTKQAAHERFVAAPLAWPQNFSVPARAVVARALEEARGFGHRYLGTEHLLLALAASDGVARDILAQHGAVEDAVRERLASLIQPEAPEIAAKLRAPKRRGVRRRSRA